MTTCQLRMPEQSHLFSYIKENARHGLRMVRADSCVGHSVDICGAGPSLHEYVPGLKLGAWPIWACNSALPYLMDVGVGVTHGFAIDQSEAMLDEWGRTFPVVYYVGSSVSPRLVEHLMAKRQRIRLFHSFLGVPHDVADYELGLYRSLYPPSVQVGHGLNSVPRAVCLALAMGLSDITVYGADCGVRGNPPMPETGEPGYAEWLDSVTLYADGRKASVYGENASMCEAEIGGELWHSRPDMVMSAIHLNELQDAFPGRITIVGKTLPNAIRGIDRSTLPFLSHLGEVSNFR